VLILRRVGLAGSLRLWVGLRELHGPTTNSDGRGLCPRFQRIERCCSTCFRTLVSVIKRYNLVPMGRVYNGFGALLSSSVQAHEAEWSAASLVRRCCTTVTDRATLTSAILTCYFYVNIT